MSPTAIGALIVAALVVAAVVAWRRNSLLATRPTGPEREREEATSASKPLDDLAMSLPEGLAVIDREGALRAANPAFVRLFRLEGTSPMGELGAVTGHRELDLLVRDTLAEKETRHLEIDQQGDVGNGRPVLRHLVVSCVELPDRSGALLTARDITDSMLLGQIRRDLVANVSHEIKTPLTAIRGFAETLRDGALGEPETAIRFTNRILQQCDRLQALLGDLLTLSRLERSEKPVELQEVRLAQLVREAAETCQPAARERDVMLSTRLDTDPVLEGDAEALAELCLNLIDNAIKYNREGGKVTLRLTDADRGEILLEVTDTGRGIPASALSRIFERFYRVDRGRSRKEGGTGLGLAIAKHAVELHGGRIEVDSILGKGTSFRVFLPQSNS